MAVTLQISEVQVARVPCSVRIDAIGPTGKSDLTLSVEMRRGAGPLASDWQFRVTGTCDGKEWRAGWSKLRYVDRPGTMDVRRALAHAASLAIYFASHDFEPKLREDAAANPLEYHLEACKHAPSLGFAIAAAKATAPWLRWTLPEATNDRRKHHCKELPPPPGNGRDFWPPFSVLPEIQSEIRRRIIG